MRKLAACFWLMTTCALGTAYSDEVAAFATQKAKPAANATPFKSREARPRGVALVIANGGYRQWTTLPNAVSDGRDIKAALEKKGYKVILVSNRPLKDVRSKIGIFHQSVKALHAGDLALIYYTGHGFSHNSQNYVSAVDADLRPDGSLVGVMALQELIDAAGKDSQAKSIVMVDACRKSLAEGLNPYIQSGFVYHKTLKNQMIVFASQLGVPTVDGPAGSHSPFAASVLKELEYGRSDRSALAFFNEVGRPFKSGTLEQSPLIVADAAFDAKIALDAPAQAQDCLVCKAKLQREAGDFKEAFATDQKLANGDDPEGMLNLGLDYAYERGISRQPTLAVYWLDRAGVAGKGQAYSQLGWMFQTGAGVPRNFEKAKKYYERGEALNDPDSILYLANLHAGVTYGMHDEQKAISLLKKIDKPANCCAAMMLGHIYRTGTQIRPNRKGARGQYVKAGRNGIGDGWGWLATMDVEDGDPKSAHGHFAQAIAMGDPRSMIQVGIYTTEGKNGYALDVPAGLGMMERGKAIATQNNEKGIAEWALENIAKVYKANPVFAPAPERAEVAQVKKNTRARQPASSRKSTGGRK